MNSNQGKDQKQSMSDKAVNDPTKDLTATSGQGQGAGSQQSGQQQGQQGGRQQSNQQSGGQQSGQQQGGQQQGRQSGNQQQGGGQHASGGTPALDDLEGHNRGESAQQASEAFKQQDDKGGKR